MESRTQQRGTPISHTNERLRRSITSHLWRCGYTPPEHSITVEVDEGTVLLTGAVKDPSDLRVVESLVAMLDGVRTVANELMARASRRGVNATA